MNHVWGLILGVLALILGLCIHFSENPTVGAAGVVVAPVVRWIGIPCALWGLWQLIYQIRCIMKGTNTKDDVNKQ